MDFLNENVDGEEQMLSLLLQPERIFFIIWNISENLFFFHTVTRLNGKIGLAGPSSVESR